MANYYPNCAASDPIGGNYFRFERRGVSACSHTEPSSTSAFVAVHLSLLGNADRGRRLSPLLFVLRNEVRRPRMSLPQFRRTGVGAAARRGMIRPGSGNEGNAGEVRTSTPPPLASPPPPCFSICNLPDIPARPTTFVASVASPNVATSLSIYRFTRSFFALNKTLRVYAR
jgi:hypothetical protein